MSGDGDDATVGPLEVFAPRGAKHACGIGGLALPFVRCAVRSQLASGQIAEPDREPGRGMSRDGAPESNLEIVGVRTENQQVDRHSV